MTPGQSSKSTVTTKPENGNTELVLVVRPAGWESPLCLVAAQCSALFDTRQCQKLLNSQCRVTRFAPRQLKR